MLKIIKVYLQSPRDLNSSHKLAHILHFWLFRKPLQITIDSSPSDQLSSGKLSVTKIHEPEFISSKNEEQQNRLTPNIENLSDDEQILEMESQTSQFNIQ